MSEVGSADGTRIGYEISGTGPAVILVDGAMCYRGSGPMRGIAAELSSGCTVVLYDRRGRGESGDTPSYRVEREIDDIEALLGVMGGRSALVGISSGGALATLAAARLRSAVSHLIVFEPPYLPEPARPAAAMYTAELTAALAAGNRDRAVAAFLARVGAPAEAIEGMRRSPAWAGMTAIATTLGYDDAVMADSAVPAAASGIVAPTLALAGGASPDFLQWGARELAAVVPDAEFRVLPAQGHDVEAAPLADAVRDAIS
ncbi:MAG: alpha/beta hydrolase [Dehalococcoidia bacterium]|nr:alpha/beta hydrolase [Dehalococcoidia bacterium]